MAEFLDTQGCSHAINEIVKNARKQLFIVSPYLRFSQLISDRLKFVTQKGVQVNIIFGKSDLHPQEEAKLQSLNVNLYLKENLHAKCYANEQHALIASMNLHQFSEVHNEEMGVLLHHQHDAQAYTACIEQIAFIASGANLIKSAAPTAFKAVETGYEFDHKIFSKAWHTDLRTRYEPVEFDAIENYLICTDALVKGLCLTTRYGFLSIELPVSYDYGRALKDRSAAWLDSALVGYRWFWSSPFDRISLYHGKHTKAASLEEELEYCRKGEQILMEWAISVMSKLP